LSAFDILVSLLNPGQSVFPLEFVLFAIPAAPLSCFYFWVPAISTLLLAREMTTLDNFSIAPNRIIDSHRFGGCVE